MDYHSAYRFQNFFDTNTILVKVSQSNARLYRDFSRIEEFFITIKNKTITMSNRLIQWNTARLIREKLAQCAFLHNFPFNEDYAELYIELCNYVDKYYNEVSEYTSTGKNFGLSTETYNDMVMHLDKVYQFQRFVSVQGSDLNGIAELANELFGNKDLRDGMAVDPTIISIFDEVLEFVQACGPMLNYLPVLTGYMALAPAHAYTPGMPRGKSCSSIPDELEHEIRLLLEHKGVFKYKSNRQKQQEENNFGTAVKYPVTESLQEELVSL